MVSSLSIAAMVVTMLLCFMVPVMLFILVRRKSKNITGAFFAGAVAFYVSQMLIRIPLIQTVLPRFEWYREFTQDIIPYALFLSLSAALFEETARYLAFRLLLKERQAWSCGVAFGIGHGGIEAILLIGLTYVNNIVLSIMINQNYFNTYIAGRLDEKTAAHVFSSLTQIPASTFLAAGVERVSAIAVHIALSVLILEGIVRKRAFLFYFFAVASHTIINFFAVYFLYLKVDIWLVELFIAVGAAIGIMYTIISKKRFGDKIDAEDEAKKAVEEGY
ncbi:MAG: YhfC family intramembrane metalloprotease [Clostridia bacterium]|nr:YhfC family intramembrane metalloprotease [Clostridia bacterium]